MLGVFHNANTEKSAASKGTTESCIDELGPPLETPQCTGTAENARSLMGIIFRTVMDGGEN